MPLVPIYRLQHDVIIRATLPFFLDYPGPLGGNSHPGQGPEKEPHIPSSSYTRHTYKPAFFLDYFVSLTLYPLSYQNSSSKIGKK